MLKDIFSDVQIFCNRTEGYVYRTGYKPPTKSDFIFLLYLLMKSQQNEWSSEFTLSKYKTIKECGLSPSSFQYKRVEDSVKRWSMVKLEFQGTFYNGNNYQTLVFGVIDEYSILNDNPSEMLIRFSPTWLYKIRESNYFKYINFEHVRLLRSPLVIRLYEILIKNFQTRDIWEIDALKLAIKIPMNEKYPSDIIPKIKASIKRINKHTKLNIKLTVKRISRGKVIFIFEKMPDKPDIEIIPIPGFPNEDTFKSLIAALPKEHQHKKTILEAMSKAFRKHGYDYVKRNIEYTNKNCKTNYRAYLNKALKEDFGLGLQEDHETKQIKAEYDKMLKKQYEKYIFNKVEEYKKENFSEDEVNNLYQYISQYYERENTQLSKEAVINKSNSHLAQQIGLPLFDEWKKHHNSSSQ